MPVRAMDLAEIVAATDQVAQMVAQVTREYDQDWKRHLRSGDRVFIQGAPMPSLDTADVVTVTRIAWRESAQFVQVTGVFGPMWVEAEIVLGRAP